MNRISRSDLGVTPLSGQFSLYLNQHETAILVTLVKSVNPKVMIEIGCNRGLTASHVLLNVPTLERYIGIDAPPAHKPSMRCQDAEVSNDPGSYAAYDDRFFLLRADSTKLRMDDLEQADVVFIDADHSKEAVRNDSFLAANLTRKGGMVIWHDAGNKAVEVDYVLDMLVRQGWPIVHVDGSWLAFSRR